VESNHRPAVYETAALPTHYLIPHHKNTQKSLIHHWVRWAVLRPVMWCLKPPETLSTVTLLVTLHVPFLRGVQPIGVGSARGFESGLR